MKSAAKIACLAAALMATPAAAAVAEIEHFKGPVTPATSADLGGLACRNYDKTVRIAATVTWPKNDMQLETMDDEGLVLWTIYAQFSFPRGAYATSGESFAIDGYFTPRNGGTHQGITTTLFEPAEAPAGAAEIPAKGPNCVPVDKPGAKQGQP